MTPAAAHEEYVDLSAGVNRPKEGVIRPRGFQYLVYREALPRRPHPWMARKIV